MSERRLVLVVGVGRSGTSLLAGVLGQLGLHIPQPEVRADTTNPKGFGEPRWVVDFHRRLMQERRVLVFDARPVAAWEATRAASADAGTRDELRAWLGDQLGQAETVVVKDPRSGWFLPLWTETARDLDTATSFVTMLRHPSEILASARRSYGDWQSDASRAAAWINVMLETERATRGERRAFVRYEDLLGDWAREVARVGEEADVPPLAGLERGAHPDVDEFVDPSLHRSRIGWDDHQVPERVRDMADEVWDHLQALARADGHKAAAHAALDAIGPRYAELYREAEAIAQPSIHAVRPRKRKAAAPPSAPPSLRVRVARRIPAPWRRRIRGVLGGGR
jgi:hypothetical protein